MKGMAKTGWMNFSQTTATWFLGTLLGCLLGTSLLQAFIHCTCHLFIAIGVFADPPIDKHM